MAQTIDEQPEPAVVTSEKSLPAQQEVNKGALGEKTEVGGDPTPKVDPVPHATTDGGRKPKPRHAFFSPLLLFFSSIGSMFAGILSISASAGQGMSKFYWHVPILYGDKSVREWPEITGFKSGCVAGGKVSITRSNSVDATIAEVILF
jgi:hypothetical protein